MSFAFHHNKDVYFHNQYLNSKEYIIPYIEKSKHLDMHSRILEIGCAEGGVLKAFCEKGYQTIGVELSSSKVDNAKKYMHIYIETGLFEVINKNIYDVDFQKTFQSGFDVIILKDTIEHIPQQDNLLRMLYPLLKDTGVLYVGFPPWYMPWGGHQQICKSKFLMWLPYFHLLPMSWYMWVLSMFGETEIKRQELREIKETGLHTHTFERWSKKARFKIIDRSMYFINPIYKLKFGLKPLKQPKWWATVPKWRDLTCTTAYYLLVKEK